MRTTWNELPTPIEYPVLADDIATDVVIIGGGLTGVLTAYLLQQAGHEVVILEADRLGGGATAYTTAFLTQGIDTRFADLIPMFGKNGARTLWEAHGAAIDTIEAIAAAEEIECRFVRCPAYIYARTPHQFKTLEQEFRVANRLRLPVRLCPRKKLGFAHKGVLEISRQAKFHPLKFMLPLAERLQARGARIFEKSAAIQLTSTDGSVRVTTKKGSVTAVQAVVATYQPFNHPRQVLAKKGMYKSYVLEAAIPHGIFPEALYWDLSAPYNYFRVDDKDARDRLILGGADHRSELPVPAGKNYAALKDVLKSLMGDQLFIITKKWAGPILEPSDGIALIGEYRPRMWIASAFSGNGMTYAAIAAQLITDGINGRTTPVTKLFDPVRPLLVPRRLWRKGRDYTEEFVGGAVRNTMKY